MHVRTSRRLRDAEHVPDFVERQPLLVAQHDGRAIFGTQLRQRGFDGAAERLAFDGIGRGERGRAFAMTIRLAGSVDRHRLGPEAAQRIDRRVVCDAEQPAREPPRRVERREVAEGLDERFLRQIFGEAPVADRPRDQADDRTLEPPDNLLERGLRSRKRLGNQTGFGDGLEIDRDVQPPP